jgi:hypothetical protein
MTAYTNNGFHLTIYQLFFDGSHKQFSDDDIGKEGPGVIADRG